MKRSNFSSKIWHQNILGSRKDPRGLPLELNSSSFGDMHENWVRWGLLRSVILFPNQRPNCIVKTMLYSYIVAEIPSLKLWSPELDMTEFISSLALLYFQFHENSIQFYREPTSYESSKTWCSDRYCKWNCIATRYQLSCNKRFFEI